MSGHFYGVGVGPGDPGLITLLGVEILRLADMIIAPLSPKAEESLALTISRPYLKDDVEIREIVFPTASEPRESNSLWQQHQEEILDYLNSGRTVVYITLGDPSLFSTYSYLQGLLQDSGFPVTTIPGVTSFCSLASQLGLPLAQGDESLCVLPATCREEVLDLALEHFDNLVLMKVSRNLTALCRKLEQAGRLGEAIMVSRCGWPDEEVFTVLADIKPEEVHYLSTILVKRKG